VVVRWFREDHLSEEAIALDDADELIAPDLLATEVANVLWKTARPGRFAPETVGEDLDVLEAGGTPTLYRSLALARPAASLAVQLDHPVYDCLYLALAIEQDAHLVTADRRFHMRVEASRLKGRTAMLGS
jgi:predicted nucleic acid-binding protein